jgi:NTE family protein
MLGLVLEGGGAKGAYHMGAVKAFLEEGYRFDGVAGTSIGALNGAVIVQGDFEAGYRMWEMMDNPMFFDIEEMQMKKLMDRKVSKETLAYFTAKLKDVLENGGMDTSGIRSIINRMVDEQRVRQSSMDLGIVTVSVSDMKPLELYKEDIPEGMLCDYLMASANVPIFKIEPIEGKYFIDGAFYDNLPINLLARKGYKDIIAVRTLGHGLTRKIEDESVRVTNLIPSDNLGRTLNFDNSQIKNNLKMGYFDAMRMARNLSGRKYYIEAVTNSEFLGKMAEMPAESIMKMGTLLRIPAMDPLRMLFEKIYPAISEYFELDSQAAYQDVAIALMEWMAEARGIDRFGIKPLNKLAEEVRLSERQAAPARNLKKVFSPLADENVLEAIGEEFIKFI